MKNSNKMIPLGLVGNNKGWPGKFCTESGHEVKGVVFGVNIATVGDEMISGVVEYDDAEAGKTHFQCVWASNGSSIDPDIDDLHIAIPSVEANERFLIVDVQTGETYREQSYLPGYVDDGKEVMKINSDLSISWLSRKELQDRYLAPVPEPASPLEDGDI